MSKAGWPKFRLNGGRMADETQVPTQQTTQPQPAAGEQLQKARAGGKVLKIVAAVLAVLFLVLAGSAYYIYRKVEQTKAALQEAFNAPNPFPQAGFPGAMPQAGGSQQGLGLFGANPGQSSLGLVTGGPGGQPQFTAEQGERMHAVMMKYADRPIVKEFIADLKKNPDMAKAFDQAQGGGNPMAVMGAIKNAKGMEALVAKYAYRPEFLSLMMEVMKDPEIKPFLGGMPGVNPGALAPQAPQPVANQPAPESSLPRVGEGEDGAPMVLDTSAISGTSSEPAAAPKTRKVPPPVDSE